MNNGASIRKTCSIEFGQRAIPFSLALGTRKHLRITVHPSMEVEVDAPSDRPMTEVLARVKRRCPWIILQLDRFDRYQPLPTPRQFVAGETHLYLGRQYRLKTVRRSSEAVRLSGRYLWVFAPNIASKQDVRRLVEAWYSQHAEALFETRMAKAMEIMTKYKIEAPPWRLLRMLKRWGSCTPNGKVLLNPDLVKAPLHCIDYVIVHELCHLREPNHSPRFFRLLTRVLPDWKRRKERLEMILLPSRDN